MPTSDKQIFDMIIRHQMYLEGFKTYQTDQFNALLSRLSRELRAAFATAEHVQLRDFTRLEMKRLLAQLRRIQATHYSSYIDEHMRMLERLSSIDRDLAVGIIGAVTALPRSIPTSKQIWSRIRNDPIAATGDLLQPFIVGLTNNALSSVDKLVKRGYGHGLSIQEVLALIIGTKQRKYRDGFFNKLNNWNRATVSTAIQHVAALTFDDISSKVFERYEWVAILDERTSEICRDYDGQVFRYGSGPLPPAHPNCRSTVVPIVGTGRDMPTFSQWYGGQSATFKQEVKQPISLEQFSSKLQRIIQGE